MQLPGPLKKFVYVSEWWHGLSPLEMFGHGLDRFYYMPGQHGCLMVIVLCFYRYWQAYWLSLCCFYNMATP